MALSDWPRPRYQPGGEDALLYYMVFGAAPESFAIDGTAYRCAGLPAGMALDEYDRETQPAPFEVMDEPFVAATLRSCGDAVESAVQAAQHCLLVHGIVRDPPDLNYLRDSVGIVQFLFDHGSAAAFDPQTNRWYSADAWREGFFSPAGAVPREHVIIVHSEDPDNPEALWYHTRGMRKFGRPDISVRNVPREHADAVVDLCNRLIEQQAFGSRIEEGQAVKMETLPDGLVCRHKGDQDDPEFNNAHVDIRFPDDVKPGRHGGDT